MAYRITDKDLESLARRLNEITNSPTVPYVDGVAQVGNFHISHAYGGVCLHRMHNTSGGVTTPVVHGHVPKRELRDRMHSFIDGIEFARG
jgi:hypothetical protein